MSKSILVIETPKDCCQCPCCSWQHLIQTDCEINYAICRETNKEIKAKFDGHFFEVHVPKWCPLKPMPEKEKGKIFTDDYTECMVKGYNACIDEILGGKE